MYSFTGMGEFALPDHPTLRRHSWLPEAASRPASRPASILSHDIPCNFRPVEPVLSGATTPGSMESPDLEAGRACANHSGNLRRETWVQTAKWLLGFWIIGDRKRIEHKIQNINSCRSIPYKIRSGSPLIAWCGRFAMMILWTLLVAIIRERLDLFCGNELTSLEEMASERRPHSRNVGRHRFLLYFEALAAAGGGFMLAQGHISMRASRERMERVGHTATTVAASLLKGSSLCRPDPYPKDLQLTIYTCLALTAAYPVCLVHKIRGNTYEPNVVDFCTQAARDLRGLNIARQKKEKAKNKDGGATDSFQPDVNLGKEHHFFEILSLELERQFRTSSKQPSKTPSMASHRVIYTIRQYLEKYIDDDIFDICRSPIVRENIDLMAMAGRECAVFAYTDVIPISFIWTLSITAWMLCLGIPIQACTVVDATRPYKTAFELLGIGLLGATALTVVNKIRGMWNPYGKGVNTFAWSLGIAREIDCMVNDYYKRDGKPVRPHSWMLQCSGGELREAPCQLDRPHQCCMGLNGAAEKPPDVSDTSSAASHTSDTGTIVAR